MAQKRQYGAVEIMEYNEKRALEVKRRLELGFVLPGKMEGDAPTSEHHRDRFGLCDYCYNALEQLPMTIIPKRRVCRCDAMEVQKILYFYWYEVTCKCVVPCNLNVQYDGPKNG